MNKRIFLFLISFVSFGLSITQELVNNIAPGLNSSFPHSLYPFKENIVFAANDGFNGTQLYYSNGTSNGTIKLTNIPEYTLTIDACELVYGYGLKLGGFKEIDSLGYFFAASGQYESKLYKTDGTVIGTTDISGSIQGLNVSRFFKMGNKVCAFMNSFSGVYNQMLIHDPITKNTSIVNLNEDIYPLTDDRKFNNVTRQVGNFYISDPIVYNDQVYYYNNGFLKSMDINSNIQIHDYLGGNYSGILLNDKFIFGSALLPSIGGELYCYDFVVDTVFLVKDINPYFNYGSVCDFARFQYLDNREHNKLFFSAKHEDFGVELWVTDGTTNGTNMVIDRIPGPIDGFSNTSYLSEGVFYRGDTLTIFDWNYCDGLYETNGQYFELIQSQPIGSLSDGYRWNNGNKTYSINDGGLMYVSENLNISVLDTLNSLNCIYPDLGGLLDTWSYDGWILFINCKLYYRISDCENTGLELYVSNDVCNDLLSINEIQNERINFYVAPNPTNDFLNIKRSNSAETELKIIDSNGKVLINRYINGYEDVINIQTLKSGIYFLQIENNSPIIIQKL